jgi:hypothetical protein
MSIKQIVSLIQFARASSLVWEAMTTPIPDDVVTFSIDDGAFKLGDGVTPYKNLPTLFTYEDLLSAQSGVSDLFKTALPADDGTIAVVIFDATLGMLRYAPSTTSLTEIVNAITALETSNATQETTVSTLLALALSIDAGINTSPENSIVVVNNGRFSNSGETVASVTATVVAGSPYMPGTRLEDPAFWTSQAKKKKADKNQLFDSMTYYVDVIGCNNDVTNMVYGITCANTNVVITNVSGSLFSVRFNNVTGAGKVDTPVVLIVSADDGTGNRLVKKAVVCNVLYKRIIAALYGGVSDEIYWGIAIDSKDNIFVVGHTKSEGPSNPTYDDALIVKYDAELNIVARKNVSGSVNDKFFSVVIDKDDNVYAIGWTSSDGPAPGVANGLVVKFNNELNLIAMKVYGGTATDAFNKGILDNGGNLIVVGWSNSEGAGSNDGILVKFDTNLNILAKKRFGGSGNDVFFDITINDLNQLYVVGYTTSDTFGVDDGLIVKFDSNLNVIAKKRYGGTASEQFRSATIDTSGNVIVTGQTASDGAGLSDILIMKLDSNLNVLFSKSFGGTSNDIGYYAYTDELGNVFICGYYSGNSFIIHVDDNLNIVRAKGVYGTGADYYLKMTSDSFGNVYVVGETGADGAGSLDATVMRLPYPFVTGTYTGLVLTGLVSSDPVITLSNTANVIAGDVVNATYGDATLAATDATLLSIVNSVLTHERDTFN